MQSLNKEHQQLAWNLHIVEGCSYMAAFVELWIWCTCILLLLLLNTDWVTYYCHSLIAAWVQT